MLSRIKLPRTTGMVLAGGRVGELSVLTLERPKAALPFGGHFRIVDFPLSNLERAGIANVGILSQYRPASLIDHIGVGESWGFIGLDRGAKILPPYHAAEAMDWYRGNADAVYQNLGYLRELGTEIALIISGDHIYSMDYRELILEHLEREQTFTIAVKQMSDPDRRYGYGVLDGGGRLIDYAEKPAVPPSDLASLTIYVFNLEPLEEVLTAFKDHDSIEFGRDVIPAMLSRYRVFGHIFSGYWAYTRTVDTYYAAHQDLLAGRIDIEAWRVRTNNEDNGLARQVPPIFRQWTHAEGSLIGEGSIVDGTVLGSVLGPGVKVARGAVITDSILFGDVVVEAGARVQQSIIDKRARIGNGASLGEVPPPAEGRSAAPVSPRGIVLIGKNARIEPGAVVPAGGIVQPGAARAPAGTAGGAQ